MLSNISIPTTGRSKANCRKNTKAYEMALLGHKNIQLFEKEKFMYKEEVFHQDLNIEFSELHESTINALMKVQSRIDQ